MDYAVIRRALAGCRFTEHARREMEGEPLGIISAAEVLEALAGGEIIEEYPDDRPYASCLILGRTKAGRPLHVVCAPVLGEGKLVIITIYEPELSRWDSEYRRRTLSCCA
ncbi:MAG: DUF4258 domain-containing protein [Nitrospirae bacterium]|nr:DUF4258 domain-containing protein [Nitrospirota bacterium]